MKSAYLLTLTLLNVAYFSTAYARNVTVMYYPVNRITDQTIAFSPNATNAAPVANPTFELKPNTTLQFRINDNVRFWWYTPERGWEFEGAEAPSDESLRDIVIYLAGDGGHFTDYLPPINAASTGSVLTSDEMETFKLGFWFVVSCGLFIVILGLARMISSQDHRP